MSRACVAVIVFLFATVACARPGKPIPLPAIEGMQAVTLAHAALLKGEGLRGVKYAKPAEYILKRVEYVNAPPWVWHVTFVHPVLNDHSALYKVDMEGKVELIEATQ